MAKSIYHPKGSKTFRDSSGVSHSVKTPHGPRPNPGLIKPRKLSAGEARFNRMYEQSDRGVSSASSGPSTVAPKPSNRLDAIRGKEKLTAAELSEAKKFGIDPDRVLAMKYGIPKKLTKVGPGVSDEQAARGLPESKFDAIRGGQLSDVKKLVAAHDKAVQKAAWGNGSEKAVEKIADKAYEKHGISLYVHAQPGIRDTEGLTKTGRDLRPVLARAERMAASGGGGKGKGRGNWGHKGRPGKRGGSA